MHSDNMDDLGGPDSYVTCPYNKAHTILRGRMQFHLKRCRAQYGDSEMVSCHFNAVHIVPKPELTLHEEMCESRLVMDSFLYNVGAQSPCAARNTVPINAIDLPPCEENWDEDGEEISVLDVVKEKAKDKGVLINLIGAPKAERKAHRMRERQRFQRVLDGHTNDHAEPSTSSKTSATGGLPNARTNDVRLPHGKGKNKGNKTTSNDTTVRNNSKLKTTPCSPVNDDPINEKYLEKNFSKLNLKSENGNYESTKPSDPGNTTSESKQVSDPQTEANAMNQENACHGFDETETNNDYTTPDMDGWSKVVHKHRNLPANSDFPMLPVSGHGRGRKRNGKH